MLELAYLNQQQLQEIYAQKITSKTNKYYFFESYYDYILQIDKDESKKIQYVSKDAEGNIIGYAGAWVNRTHNIIERAEIINFTEKPKIEGSRDLFDFLEIVLIKKNFRKIMFYVAEENPAARMYERFIDYSEGIGRKVGILKEHYILNDGKKYDVVVFEIFKDKFAEWFNKKFKKAFEK
jgi:hypothetical protein